MRTVLLAASLCSVISGATAQTARPDPGPLTIARQGSFFVRHHHGRSDVCALPGSGRCARRSHHADSWLLPDR